MEKRIYPVLLILLLVCACSKPINKVESDGLLPENETDAGQNPDVSTISEVVIGEIQSDDLSQDTPASTVRLYERAHNTIDQAYLDKILDRITTQRFWEVAAKPDAEATKYYMENGIINTTLYIMEIKELSQDKASVIAEIRTYRSGGNYVSEQPYTTFSLIRVDGSWYLDYIES